MSGDSAKALAAYKDFLALWKDADPDVPHTDGSQGGVREARAEQRVVQEG